MSDNQQMTVRPESLFPTTRGQSTGAVEVQQTRAMAEVQAAMAVAKRFPRDEASAFARIMEACKRPTLAEHAIYAYPRGGEMITGPSIHLAKTVARSWGNIDYGIIELEQRDGASAMLAYAWDMETNTRQSLEFLVPHERHTKQGVKTLTDPRDIYETTANQGSRRLRACILGVIPEDVVDEARRACEQTLAKGGGEPIGDRIRKCVAAFVEMGVKVDAIERRIGHKIDATTEPELVRLRQIYRSIKDGMSAAADCFPPEPMATVDPTNLPERKPRQKAPAATVQAPTPPAWIGLLKGRCDAYLAGSGGIYPDGYPEDVTDVTTAGRWIDWFDAQAPAGQAGLGV